MPTNYVDNIEKISGELIFNFDIHDKRFPETTGSSSTTTLLTVKPDGTTGSVDTNQTAGANNKVATMSDINTIGDNLQPTFTQAQTRTNIVSGETLSTLFGKIKKWFADLKDLAFIEKDGPSSTKYLRGDGTWQTLPTGPTDLKVIPIASGTTWPVTISDSAEIDAIANGKAVITVSSTGATGKTYYFSRNNVSSRIFNCISWSTSGSSGTHQIWTIVALAHNGETPPDYYTLQQPESDDFIVAPALDDGDEDKSFVANSAATRALWKWPSLNKLTVTLEAADWSSNTQTVTATGVTATCGVSVAPQPSDTTNYVNAGILCTAQASNSLTFTCTTVPSNDIVVNVMIF